MDIKTNIEAIRKKVKHAAEVSGRNEGDIILVAASKTQSCEKLIEARNAGISVFGENKVQELVEKYPYVDDIKWHLIGKLQKNKVKYIIDKVDMIHSLDSIELAAEINKRAEKTGRKISVLIQINIGKEDTKSGIYAEDVLNFAKELSELSFIIVRGVMAIPPASENSEDTRVYFREMKNIFDALKNLNYENFKIEYLSMGMTHDFETAIEEGANIVRIGTGIFGERNYNRRD